MGRVRLTHDETLRRMNALWELAEEHLAGVWRVTGIRLYEFFDSDTYILGLERWSGRVGDRCEVGFCVSEVLLYYWRPSILRQYLDLILDDFDEKEHEQLFRVRVDPREVEDIWDRAEASCG